MGSKSQTTKTVYGNTTTTNPYATAQTNNKGTTSDFKNGTALNSIYDFVNKRIDSLLDEYLNPNLNSVTNQAKLNSFTNSLNANAYKAVENNIISPLSERNMIRSSQANDLYRNLSDNMTNSLAAYINGLLADSQNNTASMLNNLLKYYMYGYSVISDMQQQSLKTSQGNATKTTATSSSNPLTSFGGFGSGDDSSSSNADWMNWIAQIAQMIAGGSS